MKKVIFVGGKQVGYDCLQCLCLHPGIQVSLIITNPSDLYKGTDKWYPSVKELADTYNIPYHATDAINDPSMVEKIKSLSPDLMFVVYYDKILVEEVFNIPKEGTINLHMADAEKYRGCYPTTYAIINGETEYGVTLHYINRGIDTGYLIDRARFELMERWTGKDLYERATREGIKLFKKNLERFLSGNVKSRAQRSSQDTHFYRRSQFPSHEITFEGSGKDVYNKIRALIFPPFPNPYFYIGSQKYTITPVDSET